MIEVSGGYDYDVFVDCTICRTNLLRTHGELTIGDLIVLESTHECAE